MSQDRNQKQYRKAQLKALEWEVRLYEQTKKAIEDEKEIAILATSHVLDGMPKGTGISDRTGNLAIKISTSLRIREMERRVEAVEKAKDEFCKGDNTLKSAFIHLYFWDNKYTADGVALKLGIGVATVFNWRRTLLELVGQYLGWRI